MRLQRVSFLHIGFVAVGIMLCVRAAGAQSRIAPPSLGYIVEECCLRPIEGIPGAALLGERLDAGTGEFDGAVSPAQDYALLVIRSTGEVRLARLAEPGVPAVLVNDVPARPDAVVVSPTGKAAAFLYRREAAVVVLRGLPSDPSAQRIGIPRDPDLLAVSDEGRILLADGPHALLTTADGNTTVVSMPANIRSAAYRPGSSEAVVAISADEVWIVGSGAARLLQKDTRISGRDRLVFSRDGKRLFEALAEAAVVRIYDFSGGNVTDVPAGEIVTGLFSMNGNATFRIAHDAGTGIRLLDAERQQPRIVSVPSERSVQP